MWSEMYRFPYIREKLRKKLWPSREDRYQTLELCIFFGKNMELKLQLYINV